MKKPVSLSVLLVPKSATPLSTLLCRWMTQIYSLRHAVLRVSIIVIDHTVERNHELLEFVY